MKYKRNTHGFMMEKCEGKKPLWRGRLRREGIKMDLN